MAQYGAGTEANALMTSLTSGIEFPIPEIDINDARFQIPGGVEGPLYKQVAKLTNAQLVTDATEEQGTFDALMEGFARHLKKEYDANRITGAEYTKAYVALTESAMGQGVQYLLGKDQSFWASLTAQMQAITAQVQLRLAFAELAKMQYEANTAKANYALTKLKLATEDAQYGLLEQQELAARYQVEQILPAQKSLVLEQVEVARAQTRDTHTDTTAVAGVLGKQKDLYTQQITSYQRDAEVKAARMFVDAWITQKTIDEGLTPPTGFDNSSIGTILTKIRNANDLD